MGNQLILISTIGLFFSCQNNKQLNNEALQDSQEIELDWLEKWFGAWELIADDVFKLPRSNPPVVLFYDNEYVYTTSKISAPDGEKFNGPKLFGEKLPWKRTVHNDTLTLPTGQRVPVQLLTFAAPSEKKGVESFFVMAAPSFWQNAGIDSKEVGLDKMLTGIFVHEFAHTRQMNGFGSIISGFEENNKFDFIVNDDIIQNYFSDDSIYTEKFKREVNLFYKAATVENKKETIELTNQGLTILRKRHEEYLEPDKGILVKMDHVFLTMEGIGQYAIVSWLEHPKGGNVVKDVAIKATRRNKKWWSQDEGLALVLLYKRLVAVPDWKGLFSQHPENIISLIEKELNQME